MGVCEGEKLLCNFRHGIGRELIMVRRKSSEHETGLLLRRYARLVPHAWERYLAKLKRGEYFPPLNEDDMRCFLFSECLDVMRRKRFDKPYEIFVEYREIYEGKKADLAIGLLEEGAAFVAVELKHHPHLEGIEEDILKLREATKSKAIWGIFLMLGPETYKYQENLDLKALGIEEDGANSAFTWSKIKPKHSNKSLETLLVILGS